MSKKITLSVDNTADLGEELYKLHNLEVVYFGVVIGDKLFRDTEVRPEDIYRAVEVDGLLPKTNAALEMDYRELFERATADGGSIIHFSVSDKLSASHQNALRAAKGLSRVHVIDSKSASVGTGLLAIKASEMVKAGACVEEILRMINDIVDRINVGLIIKDLNYLYRGGRASGLKLLGANLLKIRPSLVVQDGKIVPCKKFKGDFGNAVREWTKHRIAQTINADKSLAFVAHTDIDEDLVQGVIKAFLDAGFLEVRRITIGTTLTTHLGRNVIGALFI